MLWYVAKKLNKQTDVNQWTENKLQPSMHRKKNLHRTCSVWSFVIWYDAFHIWCIIPEKLFYKNKNLWLWYKNTMPINVLMAQAAWNPCGTQWDIVMLSTAMGSFISSTCVTFRRGHYTLNIHLNIQWLLFCWKLFVVWYVKTHLGVRPGDRCCLHVSRWQEQQLLLDIKLCIVC